MKKIRYLQHSIMPHQRLIIFFGDRADELIMTAKFKSIRVEIETIQS